MLVIIERSPELRLLHSFPPRRSSDLRPTAHYVRDRSHGYLSPHVQVSFPVTDRTNFRLSYSHQVQAPDFGLLLGGDRKSTRLNSSHLVISYAVFCLK